MRLEIEVSSMSIFNSLSDLFCRKPRKLATGSSRAQRGRYGEDLAADYCKRTLGYRIITRNWRYKRDELDIICWDSGVLVFVEVRARAEDALVDGFHSIDAHKKRVLLRGCKSYINRLQNPPKHVRFDVIDVLLPDEGEGRVRHYGNVPLFPKHYTYQA
tara:strand:- start:7482 stop:7958 length:477 start_codon:yes stop_codon:yes gene_type:complete